MRDSDAYLPVPLLKVQIGLVVSRRSTYHYLAHVPRSPENSQAVNG